MAFPTKDGSNSFIWKLKDVYNARLGDNWPSGAIGLISGGYLAPARLNNIQKVTLGSTGNATDFGDLSAGIGTMQSGQAASTTRGIVVAGGESAAPASALNNIEFSTFATLGNSTDFGDLTRSTNGVGSLSSSTRAVFAGGTTPSSPFASNIMDFITIASTGNASDFGDTLNARTNRSGVSSSTRGVYAGAFTSPSNMFNEIEFITIASTGNATVINSFCFKKASTSLFLALVTKLSLNHIIPQPIFACNKA